MTEQLEQLWYTWSKTGLGGALGFRVRAASAGLADTRSEIVRASDPYLQYTLPLGTILEQANPNNSPVSLTFAEAGNKLILVQRVFAGEDAYGRSGNYFCHLVAELPENFCAQDAIDRWQSAFWEVSDQKLAPDEKSLVSIASSKAIPEGPLRPKDLVPLSTSLRFLIRAYCSLETNQRLYIMARDEQVATLIWGLTRCLPKKLQQRLTFSTYEYDVLRAKTRIVGTSQPTTQILRGYQERVADLPANCYSTLGFALNCYINKSSPLPDDPIVEEYADYAIQKLLAGGSQIKDLTHLLDAADQLDDVKETKDFLVVYKFDINPPEHFSQENIQFLLSRPRVAVELLTRTNIQEGVIQFILHHTEWWLKEGKKMVESLVGEYPKIWLWVLQQFPPSPYRRHPLGDYSWQVRKSFLEVWKLLQKPIEESIEEESIDYAQFAPWLLVSWSELPELLKLELPSHWNVQAIMYAVTDRTKPIPSNIVSLMTAYRPLFETALTQLMEEPEAQQDVQRFFSELIERRYKDKVDLLVLLLSVEACLPTCMNTLLKTVPLSKDEKISVFDRCGTPMLKRVQGERILSPTLLDMAEKYVQNIEAAKFTSKNRYLLYLMHSSQNEKLSALSHDWYLASMGIVTKDYLPSLDSVDLPTMVQAIIRLQLHRNNQYMMNELLWTIMQNVSSGKKLAPIIKDLGKKPLYDSPWVLFQALAEYLGEDYKRLNDPKMLVPYVVYGLVYVANNSKPISKLDDILPKLFKNVHPGAFEQIYNLTWNQLEASKQRDLWKSVASRYRPQTLIEKGANVLNNLPKPFASSKKSLPKYVPPRPQTPRQDPSAQPQFSAYDDATSQQTTYQSTSEQNRTTMEREQVTDARVERMVKVQDLFWHWRISVYEDLYKRLRPEALKEKDKYIDEINYIKSLLVAELDRKRELAQSAFDTKYLADHYKTKCYTDVAWNTGNEANNDKKQAIKYIQTKHKGDYQKLDQKQVEEMLEICIQPAFIPGYGGYLAEDEERRRVFLEGFWQQEQSRG